MWCSSSSGHYQAVWASGDKRTQFFVSHWHSSQKLEPVQTYYFDPTDSTTLPLARLRDPVANLQSERDKIVAALDLVFTGI
ncbi:MAG: CcdB family protein [Pseudomonadota bacterium]|nr:CcdB family protein [Pseudomonadota bacterium]